MNWTRVSAALGLLGVAGVALYTASRSSYPTPSDVPDPLVIGDIAVTSDLSVAGDVSVDGGVVGRRAAFSGDLQVGGDAGVGGSVTVGGALSLRGDADFDAGFVARAGTFRGALGAWGDVSVDGGVNVVGDVLSEGGTFYTVDGDVGTDTGQLFGYGVTCIKNARDCVVGNGGVEMLGEANFWQGIVLGNDYTQAHVEVRPPLAAGGAPGRIFVDAPAGQSARALELSGWDGGGVVVIGALSAASLDAGQVWTPIIGNPDGEGLVRVVRDAGISTRSVRFTPYLMASVPSCSQELAGVQTTWAYPLPDGGIRAKKQFCDGEHWSAGDTLLGINVPAKAGSGPFFRYDAVNPFAITGIQAGIYAPGTGAGQFELVVRQGSNVVCRGGTSCTAAAPIIFPVACTGATVYVSPDGGIQHALISEIDGGCALSPGFNVVNSITVYGYPDPGWTAP